MTSSVWAVVPARDEEATIGGVVREVQAAWPGITVIVADNGSRDRTMEEATAAGALVVREPVAGYGRACLAGLRAVPLDGDVVVFLDGDGSDCAEDIPALVEALAAGAALALAVRGGGRVEPGSIAPAARFGNWLCGWLLWLGWGRRLHDLAPLKAVSRPAIAGLRQDEQTYGWTVELLALALQHRWAIAEVPTGYRHRRGGASKVSGDLRASFRAGVRILATIARVRWRTLDGRALRRLGVPAGVAGAALLWAVRCRGR
ncbi:MAG: glycosyltransferase family 2 protein [Dehalococcoidia bacterium]